MKLLFITDTHIRGTSPKNRKDNFPESLQRKIDEIISAANELKVDAVLHGGDFFDTPNPSLSVCLQFIPAFMRSKAPVYTIAGNHDIFGHNPDTLPRTMLGFLSGLGTIRLLGSGEKTCLKNEELCIQISGQHYHYDMDRRSAELDYCITKDDGCDYALHMVHGMLYNKTLPFVHTVIDDIVHTEADVTLCGHNHLGFEPVDYQGKLFLNPGSISRLSNHRVELIRHPSAILLDFSPQGVSYEYIYLKAALKGEEVLDRSALEKAAFQEEKLAEFIREIRTSGDFKHSALDEIIQAVADRNNVSEGIRKETLKRIGIARERLEGKAGEEN